MKKIGVVEREWESYRREVIPVGAPEVQIQESRRAFYGGARSLLAAIVNSLDPDTEPVDEDVARMEEIHAELEKFAQDVKTEQA